MTKLYELAASYQQALESAVDPTSGEIVDAVLGEQLDKIEAELEAKALDVGAYIVSLQAECDAFTARAETLIGFAASAKNRAESLKRYLASHLAAGARYQDDRVKIGWRKSEKTMLLVSEADLPEKWVRRTELVAANLTELREAIKAGDPEVSKYAALEVRHHVQIK